MEEVKVSLGKERLEKIVVIGSQFQLRLWPSKKVRGCGKGEESWDTGHFISRKVLSLELVSL